MATNEHTVGAPDPGEQAEVDDVAGTGGSPSDAPTPVARPTPSVVLLMREIEERLADGGDWCSLEKAHALAAIVVGMRPSVVCEIGVWMGGSLVPMLLALRALADLDRSAERPAVRRIAIAIDPWSTTESCAGQHGDNERWWRGVDHEQARVAFVDRLDRHNLRDLCEIVRLPADDAPVPPEIDLLHVDGNHAGQAVRDVSRFGAAVRAGGILVLDDLGWHGGHVQRAKETARGLGFRDLYPLGTGIVMQRIRWLE